MTPGAAEGANTQPVTAIDIALEPDQTMVGHAQIEPRSGSRLSDDLRRNVQLIG
jgi:hypothetical protein